MIGAATNKDFGVIATDSAQYDTEKKAVTFESPKLAILPHGAMSFIGTGLYFVNMDRTKLTRPFGEMCLYLSEYLKTQREPVAKLMKEGISDVDEQDPNFCLFLLGFHNGHPVVAQLNSFADFVPRYLWSSNGLKFSTILYGDDSDKAKLFKSATEYAEMKAKSYENLTPGIVGEILTRSIYRKADEEMKIGDKKKYAGGPVNCAMVDKNGVRPLSGWVC